MADADELRPRQMSRGLDDFGLDIFLTDLGDFLFELLSES
jgi:hypothetical protein